MDTPFQCVLVLSGMKEGIGLGSFLLFLVNRREPLVCRRMLYLDSILQGKVRSHRFCVSVDISVIQK